MHSFLTAKIVLAIVLPALLLLPIFLGAYVPAADRLLLLGVLVWAALVGFYAPDVVLARRIRLRQIGFEEGFPDALDMLVVCVEAGLGLDAAIQRVGREMAASHPELATEFGLASLELRAGKSREAALRALAERTGVEQVRALVTVLIQAEHFGTSVATALREHANEMRIFRIQKAQERAAKLPIKLIFPVLFFIFPAIFLVILGPALIQIVKGFAAISTG
jgi:tight adherence protein C